MCAKVPSHRWKEVHSSEDKLLLGCQEAALLLSIVQTSLHDYWNDWIKVFVANCPVMFTVAIKFVCVSTSDCRLLLTISDIANEDVAQAALKPLSP